MAFFVFVAKKQIDKTQQKIQRYHECFQFINTFIISLNVKGSLSSAMQSAYEVSNDTTKEIIDSIKPFLTSDGGDVEFIKYEDNIVYLKLLGACANCSIIDVTLKDGIESTIMEEVPEVKGVVNVTD